MIKAVLDSSSRLAPVPAGRRLCGGYAAPVDGGEVGHGEGRVMPRWVFLLGVGLLLVAGAFVVTDAALAPTPGVTGENCDRIRKGMTLANVEAILGGPASQVLDIQA